MKTINEPMKSSELDEWLLESAKWRDAHGRKGKDTHWCVCGHPAVERWATNDHYHQFDAGTGKASCRAPNGSPACACEDFVPRAK